MQEGGTTLNQKKKSGIQELQELENQLPIMNEWALKKLIASKPKMPSLKKRHEELVAKAKQALAPFKQRRREEEAKRRAEAKAERRWYEQQRKNLWW